MSKMVYKVMKVSMPTRIDVIVPSVDFPSIPNRLLSLIVRNARMMTGMKRR